MTHRHLAKSLPLGVISLTANCRLARRGWKKAASSGALWFPVGPAPPQHQLREGRLRCSHPGPGHTGHQELQHGSLSQVPLGVPARPTPTAISWRHTTAGRAKPWVAPRPRPRLNTLTPDQTLTPEFTLIPGSP